MLTSLYSVNLVKAKIIYFYTESSYDNLKVVLTTIYFMYFNNSVNLKL